MILNGSSLNTLVINSGGSSVTDVMIRRLKTKLYAPGTTQARRWAPEKTEQSLPTELERIQISAVFLHLKGTDGQDIAPSNDLVTITNIFLNVEPYE